MAFMQSASFDLWMSAMSKLQLLFHLLYIWNALERTKCSLFICCVWMCWFCCCFQTLQPCFSHAIAEAFHDITYKLNAFFITLATFSFGILEACITLLLHFYSTLFFPYDTEKMCISLTFMSWVRKVFRHNLHKIMVWCNRTNKLFQCNIHAIACSAFHMQALNLRRLPCPFV